MQKWEYAFVAWGHDESGRVRLFPKSIFEQQWVTEVMQPHARVKIEQDRSMPNMLVFHKFREHESNEAAMAIISQLGLLGWEALRIVGEPFILGGKAWFKREIEDEIRADTSKEISPGVRRQMMTSKEKYYEFVRTAPKYYSKFDPITVYLFQIRDYVDDMSRELHENNELDDDQIGLLASWARVLDHCVGQIYMLIDEGMLKDNTSPFGKPDA